MPACSDVSDGAADVAPGGAPLAGAADLAVLCLARQLGLDRRHHGVWRRHCLPHGLDRVCRHPADVSAHVHGGRHLQRDRHRYICIHPARLIYSFAIFEHATAPAGL